MPDASWHPLANAWYAFLASSGQSAFYEPSDWGLAVLVAESMSRDLNPQVVGITDSGKVVTSVIPLKGACLSAYMRAMNVLLVTEGDPTQATSRARAPRKPRCRRGTGSSDRDRHSQTAGGSGYPEVDMITSRSLSASRSCSVPVRADAAFLLSERAGRGRGESRSYEADRQGSEVSYGRRVALAGAETIRTPAEVNEMEY